MAPIEEHSREAKSVGQTHKTTQTALTWKFCLRLRGGKTVLQNDWLLPFDHVFYDLKSVRQKIELNYVALGVRGSELLCFLTLKAMIMMTVISTPITITRTTITIIMIIIILIIIIIIIINITTTIENNYFR